MINAHSRPPSKAFRLGVLVLLLAAWALLLFRLNDVPPGFQHDQMFNSLDALSIGSGRPAFPLYFPANFGREALGIYPVALIFKLAGGHFVWSLRFTSVLWGMAALSLTVVLAQRYMPRAAALVAGALLAGSFWFIFTTRLGLEPALLIALATGTIYFLSRGLANRTWRDFAAAGLLGGLAVHTYLASRGLFVLLALLLGYELLGWLLHRLRNKEPRVSLRQTAVPGLLLAALSHGGHQRSPVHLSPDPTRHRRPARRRAGRRIERSPRGDLRPLLANVRETMLAVLWSGPYSLPYHYNVPGRPVLQPLLALFFLVGLGIDPPSRAPRDRVPSAGRAFRRLVAGLRHRRRCAPHARGDCASTDLHPDRPRPLGKRPLCRRQLASAAKTRRAAVRPGRAWPPSCCCSCSPGMPSIAALPISSIGRRPSRPSASTTPISEPSPLTSTNTRQMSRSTPARIGWLTWINGCTSCTSPAGKTWFGSLRKTSRRFRPRATLCILFRLRLRTCHRRSHCW